MEATVVSKQCKECGDTYPLSGFPKNREMRDGHINTCKPCNRVYMLAYHRSRTAETREARRQVGIERRKKRQAICRAVIAEAKDRPCVDCGVQYPAGVMDFDHVRGEKLFAPSQHMNGPCNGRAELLEAEIAKCEVRCANCHRMRHWREKELLA